MLKGLSHLVKCFQIYPNYMSKCWAHSTGLVDIFFSKIYCILPDIEVKSFVWNVVFWRHLLQAEVVRRKWMLCANAFLSLSLWASQPYVDRTEILTKWADVIRNKGRFKYIVPLFITVVVFNNISFFDEISAGFSAATTLNFKDSPSRWLSQLKTNVKVG